MTEMPHTKGQIQMHYPSTEGGTESRSPDVPQPARRPLLVLFLMLLAIGTGSALAIWMHRPSEAAYIGYLQAEGSKVTAGRPARLARILVSEQQTVKVDTPLVVLADPELDRARQTALGTIKQLEAELSRAQAQAVVDLQWRLDELEQDMFQTRLKSAGYLQEKLTHQVEHLAQLELMDQIENSTSRKKSIGEIRQIRRIEAPPEEEKIRIETLLKIHESENAMEVADAQIDLCDQRLAGLEQLKAELPEKVRLSMGIHVVEARLADAKETLARLQAAESELTLRATVPGTVGVLQCCEGEQLAGNDPIVEIFDEQQRYLLVNVPTTDLNQFAEGTELDLEFPNNTHRRGRVAKTSAQALPLAADGSSSAADITKVAVRVEAKGKLWPQVPFRTTIKVRPLR